MQSMNKKKITDWVSTENSLRLWDDKVTGLFLKRNSKSVTWNLSYKAPSGKKQSIKLGVYPSVTLDSARTSARAHLNSIALGNDPVEAKQKRKSVSEDTIQRYLDSVYSGVLKRKKSGNETLTYFKRHCSDLLKLPFAELSSKHIHKWHMSMLDKELSDASIQRVYGAFKTLVNDAVKREHIETSPIQHVTLDKIHRPSQGVKRVNERKYLTQTQISALKNALDLYQAKRKDERANSRQHGKPYLADLSSLEFVDFVKPATLLMFYTGFRPGDIRTLRWSEVDLGASAPAIRKVIEKTQHKSSEPQSFPLVPDAVDVLTKWKRQTKPDSGALVFPSDSGGLRTKRFLSDPWKKHIRSLAGLPDDVDLYNLRHNFASWLVMSGADLLTVAKLMGHANTKMVEKHYGHLAPEHKQNALTKAFTLMSEAND